MDSSRGAAQGLVAAAARRRRCRGRPCLGRAAVLAAVVTLSCPRALAGDALDGKRTTLLTPDTFDVHLRKEAQRGWPCLVMFHVSWCKVCQRAFPKFANASVEVEAKQIAMSFAHVDCTDEKTLCQRFAVKGYPSIRLFQPGKAEPRNYKGSRTEEQFVKYAERMILPPILTDIGSVSALVKKTQDEVYLPFLSAAAPEADGQLPSGLLEVADSWMDRHLFVNAPRLQDLLPEALSPPPEGAALAALAMGRHQWPGKDNTSESPPVVAFYTGSLHDAEAINAWVEKNRFPGVWMLNEDCFFEFTHANRSTVIVAVNPANVTQEQEASLRGVAKKYDGQFFFGVLDGVSWAEELRDFNLAREDLPRVLVTEENFDIWIEDIERLRLDSLDGDLADILKGSPILRQGRDVLSKLKFYFRESIRLAVRIRNYARRGPVQALVAAIGCFTTLMMVLCLGWAVSICFQAVFFDADEPPYTKSPHKKYK